MASTEGGIVVLSPLGPAARLFILFMKWTVSMSLIGAIRGGIAPDPTVVGSGFVRESTVGAL